MVLKDLKGVYMKIKSKIFVGVFLFLNLFIFASNVFAANENCGLEDTFPIKTGFFLELYLSVKLNSPNMMQNPPLTFFATADKYDRVSYDEADNSLNVEVEGNFNSEKDILGWCIGVEQNIRIALMDFPNVKKNITLNISAFDQATKNVWDYKNGEVKIIKHFSNSN
jgi:hypothetical protein